MLRAMSDNNGERKPVAAAMRDTYMFVVCDDGSVWRRNPERAEAPGTEWKERTRVPGTRRANEQASERGGLG